MFLLWLLALPISIALISIYFTHRYGCTFIGLTGGIATGKSTVSRHLRTLNATIIDFDLLARIVVEPGRLAYKQIKDMFGPEIIAADGTIDRQKLGQIAFNDRVKLRQLNQITKLPIMWEFAKQAVRHFRSGHRIIILDVPLLFESHLHHICQSTLLISVDRETQIRRLIERDNIDRELAETKIDAQWPMDKKKTMADLVIDNSADEASLHAAVSSWYDMMQRRDAYAAAATFPRPTIAAIVLAAVFVFPIWVGLWIRSKIGISGK